MQFFFFFLTSSLLFFFSLVAADYLAITQYSPGQACLPTQAQSSSFFDLQQCSNNGKAYYSAITSLNSTAFTESLFSSPTCSGAPLSSTVVVTQPGPGCMSDTTSFCVSGAWTPPTQDNIGALSYATSATNGTGVASCPIPPSAVLASATFTFLPCENAPTPNPANPYNSVRSSCNATGSLLLFPQGRGLRWRRSEAGLHPQQRLRGLYHNGEFRAPGQSRCSVSGLRPLAAGCTALSQLHHPPTPHAAPAMCRPRPWTRQILIEHNINSKY